MKNRTKPKNILLKINFLVFPYLWITTVVLAISESVTYSGFISTNFKIDIRLLVLILIFSGVLSRILVIEGKGIKKQYEFYRSLAIYNKIFFPAFLVIVLILEFFEFKNFRGYVYTSFIHIDPQLLLTVLGLSFFLILLRFDSLISVDLRVIKVSRSITRIPNLVWGVIISLRSLIISGGLLALLLWIIVINVFSAMSSYSPAFINMLKHPLASWEWKMREAFGPLYYDFIRFIIANTPENSVILVPQMQHDWPQLSNIGYTRYFLYPRTLVSEDDVKILLPITHAIILGNKNEAGALLDHFWPKEKISAKRLIFMPNVLGGDPVVEFGDYKLGNSNSNNWGIIEL